MPLPGLLDMEKGGNEVTLSVIPLIPGLLHLPKVTLYKPNKGRPVFTADSLSCMTIRFKNTGKTVDFPYRFYFSIDLISTKFLMMCITMQVDHTCNCNLFNK